MVKRVELHTGLDLVLLKLTTYLCTAVQELWYDLTL